MAVNLTEAQRYPFYVIPDIEMLATVRDPVELRMHRRRIAANIGDPDAQRAILGDASDDFHDFYGTSDLPRLSTVDTINSFIQKFGGADTQSEMLKEKEGIPEVSPVIDYAAIMEDELEQSGRSDVADNDATLGAIDSFLSHQPAPRIKPRKEIKEVEKPSLTEGFAKIMIKNGNYRRALEIITKISLNNPEKSIYFADQIRFLKIVISLESH